MGKTDQAKIYTEEEVEDLLDQAQGSSYYLGIASGWEQASAWLREKSGELFKQGKDSKAQDLRTLAEEATGVSQDRRKLYDEREADWDERQKQEGNAA